MVGKFGLMISSGHNAESNRSATLAASRLDTNTPSTPMRPFKKPPVVEVWVSFEFAPKDDKRAWSPEILRGFVQELSEELPELEVGHQRQLEVRQTSPADLPQITGQRVQFHYLRLTNADKTHAVQVGDDRLSCHLVKSPDSYPRYSHLKELTNKWLAAYSRQLSPLSIRQATLHYLDVIEIPKPALGAIDLGDYFGFHFEVPSDPFGPMGRFAIEAEMDCNVDRGPMLCRFSSIPTPPDAGFFRFRLEWHKLSVAVNSLDMGMVWGRMDAAHDYLQDCFLKAMKPETLALFDLEDKQ